MRMGWWGGGVLDWVGFGWTRLDYVGRGLTLLRQKHFRGQARMRSGMMEWPGCHMAGAPGVVLPVNPSTLRVFRHLQKFDPLGYPLAGVSEPLGLLSGDISARFWRWLSWRFNFEWSSCPQI